MKERGTEAEDRKSREWTLDSVQMSKVSDQDWEIRREGKLRRIESGREMGRRMKKGPIQFGLSSLLNCAAWDGQTPSAYVLTYVSLLLEKFVLTFSRELESLCQKIADNE